MKNSSLNENQIELLQKGIESLHSIQEWKPLTEAIVLEGIKLVGGGQGIFFVFDQSLKQLIPQSSQNLEKSEKKELIERTQHKFQQIELQTQRYLHEDATYFFPLTRQKAFTGVLVIIPQQEEELSEKQINIVNFFMQSVPIILENSRLFLIMQRKSESLNFMTQLQRLVNQYSFQEILAEIVQKVGELLNSEMAGIMLYDPIHNELRLQKPAFGSWQDTIIEQYRVTLTEKSNARDVFLTGIPYITSDAQSDERFNQNYVKLFKATSIITVPLLVDNNRIGILHAINKNDGYFTQDDLHLLMDLSEQLGLTINAALEMSHTKTANNKRLEIERYLIHQLFDCLLFSNREKVDEAYSILKTLEITLKPRISILRIGVYDNGEWFNLNSKNVPKGIRLKMEELFGTPCMIYKDGAMIALVSHDSESEILNLSYKLHDMLHKKMNEYAKNQKLETFIGVGESVGTIELIDHSYQQASQILNALPKIRHLGNVGYYPACGSWTLLSSMILFDETNVSAYTNLYLKKINQLKNSREIKETLEVYLKHNGQIKKAAEELFVHQNTLKYRIEKITDMTGFDLGDSEVRLSLSLALRLEHLMYSKV
ncbi:helix-turn-helix domain-containing protein [Fredinandcohnia sp. QZ13]|uniref:helix-turn-helix domain-containing protein n=1 Tax=Fredinandcohnia sp. QZ13 TaxID=3073144 RepID=UPI002853625B|nr:helix-turn-helix domain-containing protein [Fredinandcohnia sp. QZ13]MDR4887342.1 helix-turn-helix domain-containing protein [Fredinandcohnia sp. QZ13]